MGAFEYRSDKHPVHDRVEELERQNELMREALEIIADTHPDENETNWFHSVANKALSAVGEK